MQYLVYHWSIMHCFVYSYWPILQIITVYSYQIVDYIKPIDSKCVNGFDVINNLVAINSYDLQYGPIRIYKTMHNRPVIDQILHKFCKSTDMFLLYKLTFIYN